MTRLLVRLHALSRLTPAQAEALAPPDVQLLIHDGVLWERVLDDPAWLPLGHAPTPTTRRGWLLHHVCCGLIMGYPWWKVALYAVLNTDGVGRELDDDGY